jgi:hypothetical protein
MIRQTRFNNKGGVFCAVGAEAVTLRVVGGDEKGSLKCETVIGTRTREDYGWQEPAAYTERALNRTPADQPVARRYTNCLSLSLFTYLTCLHLFTFIYVTSWGCLPEQSLQRPDTFLVRLRNYFWVSEPPFSVLITSNISIHTVHLS